MLIQLELAQEEAFRWRESLEIPVGALERSEVVGLSPVDVEGEVTFTDPGYYLRARMRYEQELACDRCLGPVRVEVSEPIELLILTHKQAPEAAEQELEEKDMSVVHLEGDELDTEPLVLEQVQLNVPMKPLCRPDCAGLCPRCGANLNHETCTCETREIDPRWSALADLRGRLAGDEP